MTENDNDATVTIDGRILSGYIKLQQVARRVLRRPGLPVLHVPSESAPGGVAR
jgi:hypothetical protein